MLYSLKVLNNKFKKAVSEFERTRKNLKLEPYPLGEKCLDEVQDFLEKTGNNEKPGKKKMGRLMSRRKGELHSNCSFRGAR
jgi:hypothetical protein